MSLLNTLALELEKVIKLTLCKKPLLISSMQREPSVLNKILHIFDPTNISTYIIPSIISIHLGCTLQIPLRRRGAPVPYNPQILKAPANAREDLGLRSSSAPAQGVCHLHLTHKRLYQHPFLRWRCVLATASIALQEDMQNRWRFKG